jgi:flagellin
MRIQNNIMALNTHRQLAVNNLNQSKSTEKLSSGYRINRAADDASGLSISEKMRAQIRGLNQASANAQDGISLIQAAEGALQETHSILQRMRELAVKAANDTNAVLDRDAIQKEIDQLTKEVDRIANTTEFNKKTLLDGSLSDGSNFGKSAGPITNIEVTFNVKEGSYAVNVTTAATRAAVPSSALDFSSEKLSQDQTVTVTNVLEGAVKDLTVQLRTDMDEEGVLTAIANAVNSQSNALYTASVDGAAKTITFTAKEYGEIKAADGLGLNLANLTLTASGSASGGVITAADAGTDAVITDFTFDPQTKTWEGTGGDNGGISFQAKEGTQPTATGVYNIDVSKGKALTLQVGANTGSTQTISIGIDALTARGLGVDALRVDDHTNSQLAIDSIELAIQHVSEQRGNLGAVQNRLEHTVANLDTVSENLTSAESRIRDVDMAKEMMNFTKNNILQQAATAMLAQANQAPQTVLQLLR